MSNKVIQFLNDGAASVPAPTITSSTINPGHPTKSHGPLVSFETRSEVEVINKVQAHIPPVRDLPAAVRGPIKDLITEIKGMTLDDRIFHVHNFVLGNMEYSQKDYMQDLKK